MVSSKGDISSFKSEQKYVLKVSEVRHRSENDMNIMHMLQTGKRCHKERFNKIKPCSAELPACLLLLSAAS